MLDRCGSGKKVRVVDRGIGSAIAKTIAVKGMKAIRKREGCWEGGEKKQGDIEQAK